MRSMARYPKIVIFAAALALTAASCAFAQSGHSDVSIHDVAKAWEAREKRVQTLRFTWDGRLSVPAGFFDGQPRKPTTYDTSFTFVADRRRIRFETRHIMVTPVPKVRPEQKHSVVTR